LLLANQASVRPQAVHRVVHRAAAEILKEERHRAAARLSDEFVPPPQGACPAEHPAELVPAEVAVQEVFVLSAEPPTVGPRAARRPVGVRSAPLLQEPQVQRPLVALQLERRAEQESLQELLDE